MRNFRLAGACIVLSLVVGCAGTATEGMKENNKITPEGLAHMLRDALPKPGRNINVLLQAYPPPRHVFTI